MVVCELKYKGKYYRYPLYTWLKYCKATSLKIIPYKDIKVEPYKDLVRYHTSDLRFPCILLQQPDGPYLVIDGNHRINKSIDRGEKTGIFFVLTENDLPPYLDEKEKVSFTI